MLTVLEKKKIKQLLFSEKFNTIYESFNCWHYIHLKSEHFELNVTENVYKSSFEIGVYYVHKGNEIDITSMFYAKEIIDIVNLARQQQAELLRKAEEEKKEREENILRKIIKKFK